MPTPRFKNLVAKDAIQVLDAFLGKQSLASFTEKIAGQNLIVIVDPTGEVLTTSKAAGRTAKGMMPPVSDALEKYFSINPPEKSVRFSFEVLRKKGRPDYIDYQLPKDWVAIEFSGILTPDVAAELNSMQDDVAFFTTRDIRKPVSGLLTPEQSKILSNVRDLLSNGATPSKEDIASAEAILMDLLDSGKIPSTVGGVRIEGLFGNIGDTGFKIPSKKYDEIQRLQAGLYGAVKTMNKTAFVKRFEDDLPGDKLVKQVRDYLSTVSTSRFDPGFRLFFSPTEATNLRSFSPKELGTSFYDRVKSKNWVTTTQLESLIREYVFRFLTSSRQI